MKHSYSLKYILCFLIISVYSSSSNNLHAQCVTDSALAAPYNSNNGQRGTMFDIIARDSVSIKCFSMNLYAATTSRYIIFYKHGSFQGFETNTGAWTLIDTANNLTSAGSNVETHIPINFNVDIAAGDTAGFYVTNDFGGGVLYTDGTSATTNLANDSSIRIAGGIGKSYPFGLTFTYRLANVTARYDKGFSSVLPVNLLTFNARITGDKVTLVWKTTSEINNDNFQVQKSRDGLKWATIATLSGEQSSKSIKEYRAIDNSPLSGTSYYRLKQNDINGSFSISNIVAIYNTQERTEIRVTPNPLKNLAEIKIKNVIVDNLKVYNSKGQDVSGKIKISKVSRDIVSIDSEKLTTGTYFIEYGTSYSKFVKL